MNAKAIIYFSKCCIPEGAWGFKISTCSGLYTRDLESNSVNVWRSKRAPTTLGQQIYTRNGGHPRHFLGNIMGYASHSHVNDCLSNQILLALSLHDLRCIILIIRKQIIAFKRALLLFLLPQLKSRRGACSPLRRA